MDYQTLHKLLSSKPEAEECFPFYPDVPVFKIKGKVFAILSANKEDKQYVNLKCDPHQSEALRMMFESIKPAYHMNKRHWISLYLGGDLPEPEWERLIDHSYYLVTRGLKAAERKQLELLYPIKNPLSLK